MNNCEETNLGFNPISSDRVRWVGGDQGERMSITEFVSKLRKDLDYFNEENLDVSGVTGNPTELQNLRSSVELLLSKLSNLDSNTVTNNSNLSGLGAKKLSPSAIPLLGATYKLDTSGSAIAPTLSVDASGEHMSLPKGYSVTSTNIKISGRQEKGKTKIIDTSKNRVGVDVNASRFPVLVQVTSTINTPTGDVTVTGTHQIQDTAIKSIRLPFEVSDNTQSSQLTTQTEVNEALAAKVQELNYKTEVLSDLGVEDNDFLSFPSRDVRNVCNTISGGLSNCNKRISSLEKVGFSQTDPSNLSTTDQQGSIQEALSYCSAAIGQCFSSIKELQSKQAELEGKSKSSGTAGCLDC